MRTGFEKVSQTLHTKRFTLNNTYRFFIIIFFVSIKMRKISQKKKIYT